MSNLKTGTFAFIRHSSFGLRASSFSSSGSGGARILVSWSSARRYTVSATDPVHCRLKNADCRTKRKRPAVWDSGPLDAEGAGKEDRLSQAQSKEVLRRKLLGGKGYAFVAGQPWHGEFSGIEESSSGRIVSHVQCLTDRLFTNRFAPIWQAHKDGTLRCSPSRIIPTKVRQCGNITANSSIFRT
jgi:hypothetical protein